MLDILSFVVAAVKFVAPAADHTEVGNSIARVVEEQVGASEDEKREIAALLVAVAFREGSLRARVEGDFDKKGRPRSFCTMQIHASAGGSARLNDDVDLCIRTGLSILKRSMRACRAHPLAYYAEGPRGCNSRRAQRISTDRMALAKRILAAATPAAMTFDPASGSAVSGEDGSRARSRDEEPRVTQPRTSYTIATPTRTSAP